jgi:dipeptidyl aminopeptidase/acylaminoacyl peptidase
MRRLAGLALAALAVTLVISGSAQAAFPGKNGRIVFSADCCVPTERFDNYLFTVDPDGTDLRRLPWPPGARWATHPQWSPDGKRIAFAAPTQGPPFGHQIWVADADGSNSVQVTHVSDPGTAAVTPTWSPDGTRIAYHWINRGIYTINVDGTGNSPLLEYTPSPYFFPSSPAWSPKGDLIAFTAYLGGGTDTRHLFTARPDGTDRRLVTRTAAEYNLADPDWSPDGRWIVYSDGPDINVIRPDGSGRKTLITGNFGSPAWSPDGTQIVLGCFCFGNGRTGIAAINSDGSRFRHVIQPPLGFTGFPNWQPIPGPKRGDYKNSNQFCKAEQAFWGDQFGQRYRNFGACVSGR